MKSSLNILVTGEKFDPKTPIKQSRTQTKFYTMKNFLNLFLTFCTLILFTSCEKNEVNDKKGDTNTVLSQRTSAAGNHSVQNGMLVFPTTEDFNQTINYLGESPESIRKSWREALSIETSHKVFSNFMNEFEAIGDDNEQAVTNLEEIYSGRIRIKTDEEGAKSYWPKFKAYSEFTNLDGVFKIGSTIIKVTENKVISLVSIELIPDLNSINDNTIDNSNLGIYVHNLAPSPMPCSCPETMLGEFVFEVGCGRRFRMEHYLHPITRFEKINNVLKAYFDVEGYIWTQHKKKGCFCCWSGQRINSTLVYSQNGYLFIEKLNNTFFVFGTIPHIRTQQVTNRMYNTIEGYSNIGSLNVQNKDFTVQLCNTRINARIDRDGWQNYFGLLQCN